MDVTVTQVRDDGTAWDLTDLLGRPVGRITKHPSHQFIIELNDRMRPVMTKVTPGPHPSLDAALAEIEKSTHGVCRLAPKEDRATP